MRCLASKIRIAILSVLLCLMFSTAAYAAIGDGTVTVYGETIWMGWTGCESGAVGASGCGYSQTGGDGGAAFGRYQFDYRYCLVDFLKKCVATDPTSFASLKPYTSYKAGNTALKSFNGLGAAWTAAYNANPELFARLQDEFAYDYYYKVAKEGLKNKKGIDLDAINDPVVKGTVYSIAIRDGSDVKCLSSVWSTYDAGKSVQEWLNDIYAKEAAKHPTQADRWNNVQYNMALTGADSSGAGGGSGTGAAIARRSGLLGAWDTIKTWVGNLANIVWKKFAAAFLTFQHKDWYDHHGVSEEVILPEDRVSSAQVLITIIQDIVQDSYTDNITYITEVAESKGWDVDMTLNTYITNGNNSGSIDYAWILAVYSLIDPDFEKTLKSFENDMKDKLKAGLKKKISFQETTTNVIEKIPVYKYKPVTVTECIKEEWKEYISGYDKDGNPKYSSYLSHTTRQKTYYVLETKDGEPVVDFWVYSEDGKDVTNYKHKTIKIYKGYGNSHCPSSVSTKKAEVQGETIYDCYYEIGTGAEATKHMTPDINEVKYGTVTSGGLCNDDIWEVFGLNREDKYYKRLAEMSVNKKGENYSDYYHEYEDDITNEQMALYRYQMFQDVYGEAMTTAQRIYKKPLTKAEIQQYLDSLPDDTSGNRKQVVKTALTLVNQISYCNNGNDSKPKQTGYDPTWFDYGKCDSSGRPSGLDSSGFVQWAFWTAGYTADEVKNLKTTSLISNKVDEIVNKEDIKAGDIGLVQLGISGDENELYNRVGIYLYDNMWIVCGSAENTVVISNSEDFRSIKVFDTVSNGPNRMEKDDLWTDEIVLYGVGSADVGGSLYTIAQMIIQEAGNTSSAQGALAELLKNRAVSTSGEWSSHSTIWDVIQNSPELSVLTDLAYQKVTPTAAQMDFLQEIFGGKTTVLNNAHVLDCATKEWHTENYGKGSDPRDSLKIAGQYGNYVYYIDDRYNLYEYTGGATMFGGSRVVSRGSKAEILAQLFPNGVPTTEAQMKTYLTTITVKVKTTGGGDSTRNLTVHKAFADEAAEIMSEIYATGFPCEDVSVYQEFRMKNTKAAKPSLSSHSYGTTFDINPTQNMQYENYGSSMNNCGSYYAPVGGYPVQIGVYSSNSNGAHPTGQSWGAFLDSKGYGLKTHTADSRSVTQAVVNIMNNHGLTWGGSWTSKFDGMHFSLTGD